MDIHLWIRSTSLDERVLENDALSFLCRGVDVLLDLVLTQCRGYKQSLCKVHSDLGFTFDKEQSWQDCCLAEPFQRNLIP